MATTSTSGSTALTGTDGVGVLNDNLIARLTQWSINHSVSETAWGDSDTEGFTARKAAREDATGTLTGKFDTQSKVYSLTSATGRLPGLNTKLVLWENRTSPNYWVFECCLLQNYQITVDMDSKEVVEWSMDFGADGRFYRPGESGAPAQALPT